MFAKKAILGLVLAAGLVSVLIPASVGAQQPTASSQVGLVRTGSATILVDAGRGAVGVQVALHLRPPVAGPALGHVLVVDVDPVAVADGEQELFAVGGQVAEVGDAGVGPALDKALDVPVRLAVADEVDGRTLLTHRRRSP